MARSRYLVHKGILSFTATLFSTSTPWPFVLADEGIIYSQTEPLSYEGVDYPGIRISYNDGVGVSPKDEYFIHYDAQTNQMAWLGYTVTYFSGEKSKKISWIRYNDWQEINDFVLPKSLTWFTVDDGKLVAPRNTREFADVVLTQDEPDADLFAPIEGAEIVE